MRPHRGPKAARAPDVVLDGLQLAGEQAGTPIILADKDRGGPDNVTVVLIRLL